MRRRECGQLDVQIQQPAVLARGRCLVVEPEDCGVCGGHHVAQLPLVAAPADVARPRRTLEDGVAAGQQRPDLLVGLDPRRREAGSLEHPVGQGPVTRGGVLDERQLLALVRQVVELALVHRLADLAVDELLARRLIRVRREPGRGRSRAGSYRS